MDKKRFVIVGAGTGGLAVALRLAHLGHEVTVLEKNAFIGGRNHRVEMNQCQFDGGPTLLMMLDPFKKLFQDVGECFEDCVSIQLCDPSYRVFYSDGTRLDATTDRALMQRRIQEVAGDDDAGAYPAFLQELESLYQEAIPNFVRKNYRSLLDFAAPAQLRRVLRHHMLENLDRRVRNRFRSDKLHQLFSFQTMYLGLAPSDAPWVYATLAYMEYGEGIWYPKGGLPAITDAIAELAVERGANMRLGAEVIEIADGRVVLSGGEVLEADAVICNADLPFAARELRHAPVQRELRYSCSAYLLYLDYEGELSGLLHHNVFFGPDFEANLDAVFHDLARPDQPAFYACVASKTDPSLAPAGHHSLFLLIPVPNLDYPMSESETTALEADVFSRLRKECGFAMENVRAIRRRSPSDWEKDFNLDRGAAFGISHDLFQSAFMRPGVKAKHDEKLFYVGASTVPGNGLPMVLISAELVEEQLRHEGVLAP